MGQVGSRVTNFVRREGEAEGRPVRNGERRRTGGASDGEEGADGSQDIYSRCENSYFGSHFMMGGERFELVKPEASLFFVENKELDLLGDRPVPFPYAIGKPSDMVQPLDVMVNIRKESIKFVRDRGDTKDDDMDLYRLEFTFDCDQPCFVQLHFNAMEYMDGNTVRFVHREGPKYSETYEYGIGADQVFNKFIFDVASFPKDMLLYKAGSYYPLIIVISTYGTPATAPHVQTTVCVIDTASDTSQSLMVKPKRQKLCVDGVQYIMQELFGIENKEQQPSNDENPYECIICMSDIRDTVILPCRHLCLCNQCADALRLKANNCPICRKPFRALIQLKAKRNLNGASDPNSTRNRSTSKYEQLLLVEALNGPLGSAHNGHGSCSSMVHEIQDETVPAPLVDDRPRSVRTRGHKVVRHKSGALRETEHGIELSPAEYFLHRPVKVVVVKPLAPRVGSASEDEPSASAAAIALDREAESVSQSDDDVPTSKPPPPPLEEICSEPPSTSSDSQTDSTNALLKKQPNIV